MALPELDTRVRFPSLAPTEAAGQDPSPDLRLRFSGPASSLPTGQPSGCRSAAPAPWRRFRSCRRGGGRGGWCSPRPEPWPHPTRRGRREGRWRLPRTGWTRRREPACCGGSPTPRERAPRQGRVRPRSRTCERPFRRGVGPASYSHRSARTYGVGGEAGPRPQSDVRKVGSAEGQQRHLPQVRQAHDPAPWHVGGHGPASCRHLMSR